MTPSVPAGKICYVQIPARGGATPDVGYDVMVHFHGFAPVRKAVITSARGVVFAGFDFGNGSGPYADKMAVRLSSQPCI